MSVAGLAVLLGTLGCSDGSGPEPDRGARSYSFESDFGGWEPDAAGVAAGEGEIPWSITRSRELASDGSTALRFHMVNLIDAGKIWIPQPFTLQPNTTYDASVEYAFATADYGVFNLFTILTGVIPSSPEDARDLESTVQGDTGNGASSNVGYQWLPERCRFTTETGADGRLHVVIGVWGTHEHPRTYFVDDV